MSQNKIPEPQMTMHTIEPNVKFRRPPRLAPGDRADVAALMHDRFQSTRARKRALALILIDDGARPEVVLGRTGVGIESQRRILKRLSSHGVQAAIFGSPRPLDQRHYDVKAIAKVMRTCLASRPPNGTLSWKLDHLTAAVRERIPGAELITSETVRFLLKKELGIKSIWHIDPYWLVQIRQKKAGRHKQLESADGFQSADRIDGATRRI